MVILPRISHYHIYSGSRGKCVNRTTRNVTLSVVLLTGSSIFAIVRGISQNILYFKPPIHHIMAKSGNIDNATQCGDTQGPFVPLNHIRHFYWSSGANAEPRLSNKQVSMSPDATVKAECQSRGELLLAVLLLSSRVLTSLSFSQGDMPRLSRHTPFVPVSKPTKFAVTLL